MVVPWELSASHFILIPWECIIQPPQTLVCLSDVQKSDAPANTKGTSLPRRVFSVDLEMQSNGMQGRDGSTEDKRGSNLKHRKPERVSCERRLSSGSLSSVPRDSSSRFVRGDCYLAAHWGTILTWHHHVAQSCPWNYLVRELEAWAMFSLGSFLNSRRSLSEYRLQLCLGEGIFGLPNHDAGRHNVGVPQQLGANDFQQVAGHVFRGWIVR